MLQQQLENIRVILRDSGYFESIIDRGISNKLARFQSLPKFGLNKCPAHLKLPWIGNISLTFENKIKSSVKHCFRVVEIRVLFSTRNSFHPSIHPQRCCVFHSTKYGRMRITVPHIFAFGGKNQSTCS